MHKRPLAAAIVAVSVASLGVTLAANAGAAPDAPQPLARTKPAWTTHARHLSHAKDSAGVRARVYLAPRGGLAAAQKFATALSTPGSAQYGKFLSRAQYEARFAPSARQVDAVSSYLRASGFRVGKIGAGNRYVAVTGNAKSARTAFGARIDRYEHAGRTVQAPSSTLAVPAALRSDVLTVSGLDTTPKRMAPATKQLPAAPPAPGARTASPCSRFYGQLAATYKADYKTKLPRFRGKTLPYAPCGYTGPQFRAAYEGGSGLSGAGVTVAIVDAYGSPTIGQDISRYAKDHGDGYYQSGQYKQSFPARLVNGDECDAAGWYGEQTLDIEAVHAMASAARIHYFASASCYNDDFLDTLARVVDANDAQLVSNSWGSVEEGATADSVAAFQAVFTQGAIQGISFLFSSGDNGDELANTGIKQADYPTSDPYVTSVGGTSDAIGPDGRLLFQTGWGTSSFALSDANTWTSQGFLYGAGGGSSKLFNRPGYQNGATTSAHRQVPDVGMDADPNTGMLVGQTQTFTDGVKYGEYRIGGTSLASPLFAGLTALRLQRTSGGAVSKGYGLLNPVIYGNRGSFTDIKGSPPDVGVVRADYVNGENATGGLNYSVRQFNTDSSLPLTTGYDNVTGIGSPNVKWLTTGK